MRDWWDVFPEAEWMLRDLRDRYRDFPVSGRKLRLFACACWRSEPNRQGRWNEFLDAVREHEEILEGRKLEYSARALGWVCARYDAQSTIDALAYDLRKGFADHVIAAALLRDIFGNPFRPIVWDRRADAAFTMMCRKPSSDCRHPKMVLSRTMLRWNNGTVPKLAQAIYDKRSFDEMPILADALEEAGCADEEMLLHLRGPGPHVRGCFVLDLLLGKS